MTFLVFILTIFILVTFHEFGHYLFARIFKVKILEFSIGFGPEICKFKTKSNIWAIRIIPLGGYVKMLDERSGIVPEKFKNVAFNHKHPLQKIIIACAGPFFNILFAFIVFYMLAIYGVQELKPYVASVNPTIQSVANLEFFDHVMIQKINQTNVTSWNEANLVLANELKKDKNVLFTCVESNGSSEKIKLDLALLYSHYNQHLSLEDIGLSPVLLQPVISYIKPDSSAMKNGLKVGDRILSMNHIKYSNWYLFAESIHNSVDKPVLLQIERESKIMELIITPDTISNYGQIMASLGVMPTIDDGIMKKSLYIKRYDWISGLGYAYNTTLHIMKLNYDGIINLINGKMSLKELSGPVTIAKAGSLALSSSFNDYAMFLAVISIGLAFMNLLPIPALDGGHILIYLIELVINKELSYNIQMQIFKLGFIFIIGISLFAIYNDLLKI